MAQHQSKLIQHLGIIAELCNEVKLAEKIDQLMPENYRLVSIWKTVQAMIINALGYAGRALYLTKRFFVNRPVEQLVGPDVTSNQLNDEPPWTHFSSMGSRNSFSKSLSRYSGSKGLRPVSRISIRQRLLSMANTTANSMKFRKG